MIRHLTLLLGLCLFVSQADSQVYTNPCDVQKEGFGWTWRFHCDVMGAECLLDLKKKATCVCGNNQIFDQNVCKTHPCDVQKEGFGWTWRFHCDVMGSTCLLGGNNKATCKN